MALAATGNSLPAAAEARRTTSFQFTKLELSMLAEVSVSSGVAVGIAVAVLGLVGTVAAAFMSAVATGRQAKATLEASRAQNRTTHEEGARVRFANWQLKKRDTFAEFLKAARTLRESPTDDAARISYLSESDRVMLVGNKELRKFMWPYIDDPRLLQDKNAWKQLVEELGTDSRQVKSSD